jgi:hypothetical protein
MRVDNPYTIFLDLHGDLLDAGYIYVGVANADPEVSPRQVYWDPGFTQPAAQPLRTRGGVVVNNGAPSLFFVNASDYSLRIRDADSNLVSYTASAATSGASYQPLDSDLTAIAALSTQPFGRSLLTAASAAAARALLVIGSYLPLAGGTMTGNILRSGAGPHTYHSDGSFTSGKITATDAGAADPTVNNGDIWLELAP